jgi:hypothetical protein
MSRTEAHKSTESKYQGVYPTPQVKFTARISGKYLGTFTKEEDAAREYDKEHERIHGYPVNFLPYPELLPDTTPTN